MRNKILYLIKPERGRTQVLTRIMTENTQTWYSPYLLGFWIFLLLERFILHVFLYYLSETSRQDFSPKRYAL